MAAQAFSFALFHLPLGFQSARQLLKKLDLGSRKAGERGASCRTSRLLEKGPAPTGLANIEQPSKGGDKCGNGHTFRSTAKSVKHSKNPVMPTPSKPSPQLASCPRMISSSGRTGPSFRSQDTSSHLSVKREWPPLRPLLPRSQHEIIKATVGILILTPPTRPVLANSTPACFRMSAVRVFD